MMILIADSGATKTEWTLMENGQYLATIKTQGINPYFQNSENVADIVEKELLPELATAGKITTIYFYGAGISNPANEKIVIEGLKKHLSARCEVYHDMLGAARALCGNTPGIACILGTGSNSCYFDGQQIVHNQLSLGYIIGDEGSGAHIGKCIVKAYVYGTLPVDLASQITFTKQEIVDTIYKKPLPSRFLASFAKLAGENSNHPFIANTIQHCFREFIKERVLLYAHYQVPVHFIGSIAAVFEPYLTDILQENQLEKGRVLQQPMPGLIDFHRQHSKD